MFYHAYENYMENAFPLDELKPLSCTGRGREGRGSLDDILGGYDKSFTRQSDKLILLLGFHSL